MTNPNPGVRDKPDVCRASLCRTTIPRYLIMLNSLDAGTDSHTSPYPKECLSVFTTEVRLPQMPPTPWEQNCNEIAQSPNGSV